MALSKRQKAFRQQEAEKEARWQEHRRLNPPPPPPPWTDGQIAEFDKMQAVLDKLMYQEGHDIDLVTELLRFAYLFDHGSMRMNQLLIHTPHYRTLQQSAAKEKLWNKIYEKFSGLKTELHLLRNSRDRGGTNVQ